MAIITGSSKPKRVDGVGKYMPRDADDDGSLASVVALSNGGFAVQWIADVDGDGDGDTMAIQRYGTNGAEVGSAVLLSNLPEVLTSQDDDDGPEIEGISLTPLANGGYALTYAALLESASRFLTINGGSPAPIGVFIAGRPVEIGFISDVPAGTTFSLSGTGPGGPLTVTLTVIDGAIEISRELLAQFTVQDRFTLNVAGVPAGQSLGMFIDSLQTLRYDLGGGVEAVDRSVTVNGNGAAGLGAPGRVEFFDIVSLTPAAGKTPTYTLIIAPAQGAESIDLTGIPNASVQPIGIIIGGLTPDADGVIAVPPAILSQLGRSDANIVLSVGNLAPGSTLNATLGARPSIAETEGVFVQTFDADGVATGDEPVRIDGPGNYMPYDDEDFSVANVVALPDGGFAVNWIADTTGDDDGDTIAIQRYTASGAKSGSVILLSDLPSALSNDDDGGAEIEALDLTPLAGGGYALTYAAQLQEAGRFVNATAGAGPLSISVVGRPVEITYGGPAGATFTLVGTGPSGTLSVQLSAVNGEIEISRDVLSQFTIQDRFSLRVAGVPQGQSISLSIGTVQTRRYEPDALLQTESQSITVANGGAALGAPAGRVEAFDIESVTPSGASANYTMIIVPVHGPESINIAGTPNTFVTPTGIRITGLSPDANGVIAVPPAILDQLENGDANIFLSVGGLANGSTLSATLLVRPPVYQPEGIFVQTFDENGVATPGNPVRIDGPGNYMPTGDGDDDEARAASVVALSDGGFAVQWIADTNGDDDGDTFAIQQFNSAGQKVGSTVLLSDLADALTGEIYEIEAVDVTPLEDGGYALTYAAQLPEAFRYLTITGGVAPVGIAFAGRPEHVYLDGPVPSGASFALVGPGPGGQVVVPLTLSGNEIQIPSDILSQFAFPDRFTLRVSGLPQGQALSLFIEGSQTRTYDLNGALVTEARSVSTSNGGAALSAPGARVEAFDIEGATAAAGKTISYVMIIQTARDPSSFSLAGVPGAFVSPSGIIVNGLTPDAEGVIAVPASILEQIGQEDAHVILSIGNLEIGSTLTATLSIRNAINLSEGIYVQTFDADGASPGNQTLTGTEVADEITGAGGNDLLQGAGGDDVIHAGAGNDRLEGGSGKDQLFGDAGDDRLVIADPVVNGETFDGGSGIDTLIVSRDTVAPVATIVGAVSQVSLAQATVTSIERIQFNSDVGFGLNLTVTAAQIGSGLSPNAALIGGDGMDQLTILATAAGTYTVPAFAKLDWNDATQLFAGGDIIALAASGTGAFTLNAAQGHTGIQALIGGGGNDTLNGTDGIEVLNGGGGINVLNGGGGDDLLFAANVAQFGGATSVFTFAGSSFNGGAGTDYLSVAGQVFFQGELHSIEGINLQPAFTATAPGAVSQRAAELWLDAASFLGLEPGLSRNLLLRGTGTLVIDLDPGDSFDGSGFSFELSSAVKVRIEGSDDADGDIIAGTSGNDAINGQGGQDIAVFAGARSAYTASMNSEGHIQIASASSGNDIHENVEIFRFSDGAYYWSTAANGLVPVVAGVVADGYVAGATVFIDTDGDGLLDGNEPFTISDANGDFSFGSDAVGPIRAIGGTNIDTGLPNLLILSAPDGSTVVNPLTTLVAEAMKADAALSESQAESLVKAAFGLDAGIDLTTFDVLGAASNPGDPMQAVALEAQKAAASVVVVLGQLLEAAGGSEGAVNAGLDALVAALDAGAVDLADEALLEDLFTASGLTQQQAQDLAQETGAFNAQIQAAANVGEVADVQEVAAPSIALARNDAVSTAENVVRSGNLFVDNGAGADTDPNGTPLAIAAVNGSGANVGTEITLASGAKLTVNANGSYSYNPNGAFNTLTASGSGALNTSATDSFSYTLAGGTTATVIVTIDGIAGAGDRLAGSSADNTVIGTSGADLFVLSQGGNDDASGGDGNDAFYLGAALTAADRIDGGAGDRDQLALQGNYAALAFDATTFAGIEQIGFLPGSDTRFGAPGTETYSYNLVMHDGNVVAGQLLTVQFNTLRAGENVTFDGSAELDGSFFTFGGQGTDYLIGSQNDDRFFFGSDGRFGAGDKLDGQGGSGDQLGLQGDYSGVNAVVFAADSLVGIELIGFLSGGNARFGSGSADGYDYDITMHDANVLAGQRLIVQSNDLKSNGVLDETLTFDGSAETDGSFTIFSGDGADDIIGGAGADIVFARGGNDRITGGSGADTLRGQGGNDVFVYLSSNDSIAAARDAIVQFEAGDHIDLSAIDAIGGGGDDAFSFIGNAAFSGTAGELRAAENGTGGWLIETDSNGDGIADLSITLTTLDPLYIPSASDFVL